LRTWRVSSYPPLLVVSLRGHSRQGCFLDHPGRDSHGSHRAGTANPGGEQEAAPLEIFRFFVSHDFPSSQNSKHVERQALDIEKGAHQRGGTRIKTGVRRRCSRASAKASTHGARCRAKNSLLAGQSGRIRAGDDEVTHDVAQCRDVVFRFGDSDGGGRARVRQISAQLDDRLFHQETGHVEGTEQHHLWPADGQEQSRVFVLQLLGIDAARRIAEQQPGLAERLPL
jgi:hypothetical protein